MDEGGMMEEKKYVFKQLAEKIGAADSSLIPELFRMLVNEEEAQLLLALPAIDTDLAEQFGMEHAEMEEKLKAFFTKGLVLKS
ncbi:hypothetical protein ACFL9U_11795, partial [Thermodesulfobacteriota bacterium]